MASLKQQTGDRKKGVYQYGNYSRYYGYRNTEAFHDVRLDVFDKHKELFDGKDVLDVGCNIGLLTMAIAKNYPINHIVGLDIDQSLIKQAKKFIQGQRKGSGEANKLTYPFNISFAHGNYVLRDSVLLDVQERHHFDLILCLSVTKWIHLNFGDTGLKCAFKRMYKQLKPNGKLILEPQPWKSYKRRKNLTSEISKNFKEINFYPQDFTTFLLSDVGFKRMYELESPHHSVKGFQRPLQVFTKE